MLLGRFPRSDALRHADRIGQLPQRPARRAQRRLRQRTAAAAGRRTDPVGRSGGCPDRLAERGRAAHRCHGRCLPARHPDDHPRPDDQLRPVQRGHRGRQLPDRPDGRTLHPPAPAPGVPHPGDLGNPRLHPGRRTAQRTAIDARRQLPRRFGPRRVAAEYRSRAYRPTRKLRRHRLHLRPQRRNGPGRPRGNHAPGQHLGAENPLSGNRCDLRRGARSHRGRTARRLVPLSDGRCDSHPQGRRTASGSSRGKERPPQHGHHRPLQRADADRTGPADGGLPAPHQPPARGAERPVGPLRLPAELVAGHLLPHGAADSHTSMRSMPTARSGKRTGNCTKRMPRSNSSAGS